MPQPIEYRKIKNPNKRYWECKCCSQLIITFPQDNAANYQCPACKVSNCDHGGEFSEIDFDKFLKESNMEL